MVFLQKWKENWELKSFTKEQLFEIVIETIQKQIDDFDFSQASLEDNLKEKYDADSVDIIATLLYLEDIFKNAASNNRTLIPTDKLGEIKKIEDIFDIIYEVLLDLENKMNYFVQIQPDFEALDKRKKVGILYSKEGEKN
jgi:acyl carrier protein